MPPTRTVLMLAGVGVASGFLSALFGVGGGVIVVPALVLLLRFDSKAATGHLARCDRHHGPRGHVLLLALRPRPLGLGRARRPPGSGRLDRGRAAPAAPLLDGAHPALRPLHRRSRGRPLPRMSTTTVDPRARARLRRRRALRPLRRGRGHPLRPDARARRRAQPARRPGDLARGDDPGRRLRRLAAAQGGERPLEGRSRRRRRLGAGRRSGAPPWRRRWTTICCGACLRSSCSSSPRSFSGRPAAVDPLHQPFRADNLLMVSHRVVQAAFVALAILALGASAAAQSAPSSSAAAFGVRVVLPNGTGRLVGRGLGARRGERDARRLELRGRCGRDGMDVDRRPRRRRRPMARRPVGSASVRSVSLFGGEVTVDGVFVKGSARASGTGANGDLSASSLSNLVVLGEPVRAGAERPCCRLAIGAMRSRWSERSSAAAARAYGYRGFVTGLHVVLTRTHGGLPAGTEIMVGYAEAAASAPKPKPRRRPRPPTTVPPRSRCPRRRRRCPRPSRRLRPTSSPS